MSDAYTDPEGHLTRPDDIGPYGVRGDVDTLDLARALIEDLEMSGIPPEAIGLIGPDSAPAETEMPEGEEIADTARSAAAGGATGAIVGGVLGSMVPLAIPGVGPVLAAGLLGAVFGAGVGGAAGGMSVAKYNSPAYHDTFQTVREGRFVVSVQHADEAVVDAAAEQFADQQVTNVTRFQYPDSD